MILVEKLLRRAMRQVVPAPLAHAIRKQWLTRRVAAGGGAVEPEVALLHRFVQSSDVAWDIGASSGVYTLALARLAARVVSFEPVPHSFEILRSVAARAALTNVALRREAVGDRVGTARMSVPVEGFYGGYYLAKVDPAGTVDVAMTSVDGAIADGVPEPAFIKCDVEGGELAVLRGAQQLIARRPPVWLLETFHDEVVSYVQSIGYATYITSEHGDLQQVDRAAARHGNYWLVPERLRQERVLGSTL